MYKVSISKIDNNKIKDGLIKSLDFLGGLNKYVHKNDNVMLKPNINGTEGITNISLVEALIKLLRDLNVGKVIIAESAFGHPNLTDMFFQKTGYAEFAKKYNVDLINLNKSDSRQVRVKNPLVVDQLKIAKEIDEIDKLINLPIMKVHYATGITLALKNLKGILVRDEKRNFHAMGLDECIVDLNNTIKPHLNILDCITCMERMGPRGGDLVNLGLLIAGKESGAVDYVGSRLMGYELEDVKHLQKYIEYNKIDLNKIDVFGQQINDVKYPFKKVEMENILPEEFDIYNFDSCSSCMNALLLSCQLLKKTIPYEMELYMGDTSDCDDGKGSFKIAFGNCSKNANIKFDIKIQGCPPYPFDLKNALENI